MLKLSTRRLPGFARNKSIVLVAAFVMLFGVVGLVNQYRSQAATAAVAEEAENGALTTNAAATSDTAASGGTAVKFAGAGGGATGDCTGSVNTPGGPDPWGSCWPGPNNTGVPAGTALTPYAGSCTITSDITLDAKTIDCPGDLLIRAHVTITRSFITGHVVIDTDTNQNWSLVLTDSTVDAVVGDLPVIASGNVTILRANITGGHNGLECQEHSSHCSIRDSWIHKQWQAPSGDTHLGGLLHLGEQVPCTGTAINGMTAVCLEVVHSSVICDPPVNADGGGCTGDINLIPHYGPLPGALVQKNLLGANTGASFCAYGGHAVENEGTRIVFQSNIFQRGTNSRCGAYGPVNGFVYSGAGNVWSDNKYDDGTVITCTAADECL